MAHEGADKKFEADEEASSSIHATGVKISRSTSRRVKKLDLDEARWAVVRYVWEHFESHGQVPEARQVPKELGRQFGKDRITCKSLYRLFPLRLRPAGL